MSNETFEKKDWFTLIISKVKQNKKILIYLSLTVVIGLFIILFLEKRKNDQNIEISKEFNKAKILIENEKKEESYFILKNIINKKHKFYSPSSLYLILDFELENSYNVNYHSVWFMVTAIKEGSNEEYSKRIAFYDVDKTSTAKASLLPYGGAVLKDIKLELTRQRRK